MKNLPGLLGSKLLGIGFLAGAGLLLNWCVSQEIQAQVLFGSIEGAVHGGNGKPVPKTLVTLLKNDEGLRRFAVVDVTGTFVFLNLRPGNYTLRAAQPGFKTAHH